jgi:hypothetical protein
LSFGNDAWLGEDLGWLFYWDIDFIATTDLPLRVELLWDDDFISKAKIDGNVAPPFFSVVIIASISTIEVIISFEPLNELQVILIFSF